MTVLSLLSEGALAHGGALRDSIGTPATGAALLYALAAATGLARLYERSDAAVRGLEFASAASSICTSSSTIACSSSSR